MLFSSSSLLPRKDSQSRLILSTDSIFIEVGKASKASTPASITPTTTIMPSRCSINKKDHHNRRNWSKWRTGLPKISELLTMVGWIVAVAVCVFYVVYSTSNFMESRENPTTATSYVESVPLFYPAITVCNWNAVPDCEYCQLSLRYATRVNGESGLVEDYAFPYERVEIVQQGMPFQCFVFNNVTESRVEGMFNNHHVIINIMWNFINTAKDIGYAGTLTFYFNVPSVPLSMDGRFGLQISFHESGTVPNVFSETNFAISGVDNFFAITKVLTTRLKPSGEYGYESVRWESLLSFIELTDIKPDVVVISVAYASLNLRKIAEVYTTSFEGFFGQVAGMIGIL